MMANLPGIRMILACRSGTWKSWCPCSTSFLSVVSDDAPEANSSALKTVWTSHVPEPRLLSTDSAVVDVMFGEKTLAPVTSSCNSLRQRRSMLLLT